MGRQIPAELLTTASSPSLRISGSSILVCCGSLRLSLDIASVLVFDIAFCCFHCLCFAAEHSFIVGLQPYPSFLAQTPQAARAARSRARAFLKQHHRFSANSGDVRRQDCKATTPSSELEQKQQSRCPVVNGTGSAVARSMCMLSSTAQSAGCIGQRHLQP